NHPTRGLLGPDEFIPLAEETGLIIPLGVQILELAMAEAVRLEAAGIGVRMAVNLSVVQLTDPHVADEIAQMLHAHRLRPAALTLEVTESAVMAELDAARATLEAIAAQGVQLVVDDFGTG